MAQPKRGKDAVLMKKYPGPWSVSKQPSGAYIVHCGDHALAEVYHRDLAYRIASMGAKP